MVHGPQVEELVRSKRAGAARLVVISDTHGRPHPRSVELAASFAPDAILHGGDVGAAECLEPFREVAPLIVVGGNIDGQAEHWPGSAAVTVRDRDGADLARILLRHICLRGPKLTGDAARQAKAVEAQLVLCGHSHVPFLGEDKGLLVFNPGSIGPRRFTLPIVFGVLDLAPGRLEARHISCETGERWLPSRS